VLGSGECGETRRATRTCRPVSVRAGLAVRVATQTCWLGTTGRQGQAEGNGGRALEGLDQLDRHLNEDSDSVGLLTL